MWNAESEPLLGTRRRCACRREARDHVQSARSDMDWQRSDGVERAVAGNITACPGSRVQPRGDIPAGAARRTSGGMHIPRMSATQSIGKLPPNPREAGSGPLLILS